MPWLTLQSNMNLVYASGGNSIEDVTNLQVNAGGDGDVTGDVINTWYAGTTRKDGVLAGQGDLIVKTADKYGINRAFFVALMDAETTSGLAPCFGNAYNFGCMRGYEGTSVEGGLDDLGGLVAKYIDGSISADLVENPTVKEYMEVYAPSFENSHDNILSNHGAVYGYLGVNAKEMQATGELKDGSPATPSGEADYTGTSQSIASVCPINCNLADNQKVGEESAGSNTGNVIILPQGELWKNADSVLDTHLGYTTDQATVENLTEFLGSITDFTDEENKEYAQYFYDGGKASGLDTRFLVAFWSVNTSNGTSEAWTSTNNAFGWATTEDFGNAKEGIIEGAKLISVNYVNDGQNTLNKLVSSELDHIVSADADWATALGAIMTKSEEYIGESTGIIPADMETKPQEEWNYEQCADEGGTGINITGSDYTEQVINVLLDEGLTPESISGILGNMQKESYINPRMIQGQTASSIEGLTDAELDGLQTYANQGKGLVQWDDGRFNRVRAEAAKTGVSPYSIEPQMAIVISELKSTTSGRYDGDNLYELYQTNTDIMVATTSFAEYFERCGACKAGNSEITNRNKTSVDFHTKYFK